MITITVTLEKFEQWNSILKSLAKDGNKESFIEIYCQVYLTRDIAYVESRYEILRRQS